MSDQNGYKPKEANKTKEEFYSTLSKKSTSKIHKTLFDYISSVASELKESQSFYTFDLAELLWRVELWKRRMPNVRPFYAVKTNSDPVILRLLVLLGFSFDCASEGEIRYVLKAGGDPKNIIFAHVIKTATALQYAASVGVELMTFDSKEELQKIHKNYPQARLLLRIVPKDVECSFDLSDKFGCEVEEAENVLSFSKSLGLNVVGVSFHVGGLCQNPNSYASTIRASRLVFSIAKKLGLHFTMLDIGGGFLGHKDSEEHFKQDTKVIQSALKENFPESDIEIIAEPGTYFACSTVSLTTAIYGKKKREHQPKDINGIHPIQRIYYVNDSIYGSFFQGWSQYGCSIKPLLKEEEIKRRRSYKSTLWGQTCCSEDLLVRETILPDLEEGEFIVWENTGAYCQVICSTFCGVPFPASRYVFINNPRLSLDWLTNDEDVLDFISGTCTIVKEE